MEEEDLYNTAKKLKAAIKRIKDSKRIIIITLAVIAGIIGVLVWHKKRKGKLKEFK